VLLVLESDFSESSLSSLPLTGLNFNDELLVLRGGEGLGRSGFYEKQMIENNYY
jgi:hypothetical protein